jgi:hypothetical protein
VSMDDVLQRLGSPPSLTATSVPGRRDGGW